MILKKQKIYVLAFLVCLYPALCSAEGPDTGSAIPIITDIEQTVQKIVLSDHDKAVQYARNGDLVSASSYIQKAYNEFPDDPAVLADYIAISVWGERYAEALAVYDQHPDMTLPDPAPKEIIKALKEVGRYEEAIRLSRSFLEEDSSNIDVMTNLIYSLIRTGDFVSAQEQLVSVLEDHPRELRFKSLQSIYLASQKQWPEFFEAVKEIKNSIGDREDPGVWSDMNEGFYLVYDEAITLARNDQFNEALDLLDKLEVFDRKSQQTQMDRIVIKVWQEKFEEALSDYQRMGITQDPPPYFLKEVARAYKRNGEEITLPEKHRQYISPYIEAIEEQENENKVQLAFIRSVMEEGETERALSLIADLLKEDAQNQEALFLQAEIYDKTGEYWKAVKVYNQIMAAYPENHAAYNLKLRSLMDLGATSLVLREAEKHPDIVDPVVVERAKTNIPMHEIRWEESKPALQKIDQFQEEYERASSEDPKDENVSENYQRIQWDRFLALRQEEKMQEIVDMYEALVQKGVVIPPWVERAAADAYLYLEKPETALEIFERLAETDESFDVQMSVYYTLVDLGRFQEAQEALDRIDQATPEKIVERGILQDNWRKADITFNKAWLLMYQDRLKKAETYIQQTKKISPFNTNLRTAEAHNHLYRGWKRRALEEFKAIRTMDDALISAQIGYARALNDNHQKAQAREELKAILEKKPTNKHALRLQRAFEVEEMSMVTFSGSYTTEDPGDEEFTLSLRGDQPVGFHHNLFAEIIRRETNQEDGNDVARKFRVGDEWQVNNNWRLVGALTGDYESVDDVGFLGEVRYQPDDHWTFDFSYESDTLDIPVRSRANGVDADLYTLSATYRASELFDTTLGVSYKDFTDDNQYMSYFWRTDTAITTSAYWKTRLGTEFNYETFSDQDVDYFSPEKVYSFYLVPMVEHTWFRRYEKFWVDRLYIGVGQKWQKDFGSSDVGYIRYEQDHQFSDTKSWLIGTTYSLNEYDGEGVNALNVYTTLRFKF